LVRGGGIFLHIPETRSYLNRNFFSPGQIPAAAPSIFVLDKKGATYILVGFISIFGTGDVLFQIL
jgi:hypothetical protein